MVHLRHGARAAMAARFDPWLLVRGVGLRSTHQANYSAVLSLARLDRVAVRSSPGANGPRVGMANRASEDCMDCRLDSGSSYVDLVLAELEDVDGVCHHEHARSPRCHIWERRLFCRHAALLAGNPSGGVRA